MPIKPIRFILISTFARFPSVITSTLAGENFVDGNWERAVLLYIAIFALVAIVIFIFNKLDKEKITKKAIKIIK